MKLIAIISLFILVSCSYFQNKSSRDMAAAVDCSKKINKTLAECAEKKAPEYRGGNR